MKKIGIYLIVISSSLCNTSLYAGTMGSTKSTINEWNGFYVGINAGGWWTSSGVINTFGTPTFANLGFELKNDPIMMEQALTTNATNKLSINTQGFIGGGQIGYNHQFSKKLMIGLDVDIDGTTQSQKDTSITKQTPITGESWTGTYPSSLSVSKNIDYIGTVRGRFGMLLRPTLLIYGTGGVAYGGVSFKTLFEQSTNITLPYDNFFPAFSASNNISQTRTGWAAGGGGEWMFQSNWSAKVEYLYTDLGSINTNSNLTQNINSPGSVGPLSGANMSSSARFAQNMVRVGVNYHFA